MLVLALLISLPILIAILTAGFARALLLRDLPHLDARLTFTTVFAGGFPILVCLLLILRRIWYPFGPLDDLGIRALFPLLLGLIGVIAAAIPPTAHRDLSTAGIAPRTVLTFVAPRWIVILTLLAAALIALTSALGAASSPDDYGRWTQYTITAGSSGTEASTTMYGWYYSTPSLLAIGALLVITAIAWWLIPRRPWDADGTQDASVRRLRAANIARVTAGALTLHLAEVLRSAGGTAQLALGVSSADLGRVDIGTPFAALGPLLWWAGIAAASIGMALWLTTASTAVPIPAPTHARSMIR